MIRGKVGVSGVGDVKYMGNWETRNWGCDRQKIGPRGIHYHGESEILGVRTIPDPLQELEVSGNRIPRTIGQ